MLSNGILEIKFTENATSFFYLSGVLAKWAVFIGAHEGLRLTRWHLISVRG